MTNLAVCEGIEGGGDLGVLVVPAPETRVRQPEGRLMLAVLESALSDWMQRREQPIAYASRPGRRRVTVEEDLRGWFTSSDDRWPYSFESICATLGLDAAAIRHRLGIA